MVGSVTDVERNRRITEGNALRTVGANPAHAGVCGVSLRHYVHARQKIKYLHNKMVELVSHYAFRQPPSCLVR